MTGNMNITDPWQQTALRLADFVRIEARMPNTHAVEFGERQLAEWLKRVRSSARLNTLSVERREFLDAEVNGWLPNQAATWEANVRGVAAFYTAYGRWPNPHDTLDADRKLGVFLANQRAEEQKRMTSFTPARRAHLDLVLPEGWRGQRNSEYGEHRTNDQVWQDKAEAIVDFERVNGRLPRFSRTDRAEYLMSQWLTSQRWRANLGHLSAVRLAHLNHTLPDWRGLAVSGGQDDTWFSRATELASFIEDHSGFPRHSAAVPDERPLTSWLWRQRTLANHGTLRGDRLVHLNLLLPGWNPRSA